MTRADKVVGEPLIWVVKEMLYDNDAKPAGDDMEWNGWPPELLFMSVTDNKKEPV